jgi:hypothetical protein
MNAIDKIFPNRIYEHYLQEKLQIKKDEMLQKEISQSMEGSGRSFSK